jgi:hypothetical protein
MQAGARGLSIRTLLGKPAVAALLSFLFPGLGLLAAGRVRRGCLAAAPAIALTVLAAAVLLFDRHAISGSLFSEQAITAFLFVDLVLLLYRIWAIVDTYLVVSRLALGPARDL